MPESRRRMLMAFFGAAGMLAAESLLPGMQRPSPQPMPSPNAPDPHVPTGLDRPNVGSSQPPTVMSPADAKQIRTDVEKLYDLASELKQQVETTDFGSTLSLGLVKKAQEIEKLAKQIKQRAKG
jgi:hypothetical protein